MFGKKKKQIGFTLIELITVISILAVLIITGMTVFYRSLRGSSRVELQKVLDVSAQHIINNMSRLMREGRVVSVDSVSRDVCFQSGSVSGSKLTMGDFYGYQTIYSLIGERIASNSSYLNDTSVKISNLLFTWSCNNGSFDSLTVNFKAAVLGDDASVSIDGDYSFDLLIRNSVY